jgi:eukaryotic-like serine/threonine-protein kinase
LVLRGVLKGTGALYLLPVSAERTGERKPIPFQEIAYQDQDGAISPDGRWLLYSSEQTGRREIFVQSLPVAAGGSATGASKWKISTAGGSRPAWRADGKEIFFVGADGKMMAVPVESGPLAFKPGVPKPLFQTRLEYDAVVRSFDVSSDGKRFLLAHPVAEGAAVPLTVILNWSTLLNK